MVPLNLKNINLAVDLLIISLVMLSGASVAVACSCLRSASTCSSFRSTPVVFVGRVESVDEEKADIVRFGEKQTVRTGLIAHFAIEEPLKGISVKTVDVVTGRGGGDCGYPFKKGERYLVYAYKTEGAALDSAVARTVIGGGSRLTAPLSANICSRTRPIEFANDDIELLRAVNRGKPETRIFGHVDQYARTLSNWGYDTERVGPLSELTVVAESGTSKYEVKTDKKGRYVFATVDPGKYTLKVQLPDGYGPLYSFEPTSLSNIDVTREDCGVEIDFTAQIDGRIGGRVFDKDGSPVSDQVQVSVIPLESASKPIATLEKRSEYTKNGTYEFEGLQPGQYLIGVNIANAPFKHSPYPTVYYPKASNWNEARVFTLSLGQKVKDIDFHLPEKLIEVVISGTVVGRDGAPVIEAKVDLFDREQPSRQLFGVDVKTDRQGRFTIRGFKGRQYFLHAWKSKNYLAGTGEQSELVPFDPSSQVQPVKLILNKAGIFFDRKP